MRMFRYLVSAAFVQMAVLFSASTAFALTNVPTTTYSTDTTWTLAGSPYILDGNVTVASGATLRISDGVVVKFNGQSRSLIVNGSLLAYGSSTQPIVFTSLQDDSIGGDSGGDGATTGAPGQWYDIRIAGANQVSVLAHVNVLNGGYGSVNWNYGAVKVTGATAIVHIRDSVIAANQRSGVLVANGASAHIANTYINGNGSGVSVNQSFLALKADSNVQNNDEDDLWFNYTASYDGPTSTVMNSVISGNDRYGINIAASSTLAEDFLPYGNNNNIYDNVSKDLYHVYNRFTVDWTGNFWGEDVVFDDNPPACLGVSHDAPGRLAFEGSTANPPLGPISHSSYLSGTTVCPYDRFRVLEGEFSDEYIDNSAIDFGGGFSSAWYSFSNSECSDIADPITMVFYGRGDLARSVNHLAWHSEWASPFAQSPAQYFYSDEVCGNFQDELVDPVDEFIDRYHVRLRETEEDDPVLGTTTVATPHYEEWDEGCVSHATVSFVQARNELATALTEPHHPRYSEYIGNSDTIFQCNNQPASSDGYVDFVYVPSNIIHPQ